VSSSLQDESARGVLGLWRPRIHRLPEVYPLRLVAAERGLMALWSYSSGATPCYDQHRRAHPNTSDIRSALKGRATDRSTFRCGGSMRWSHQ